MLRYLVVVVLAGCWSSSPSASRPTPSRPPASSPPRGRFVGQTIGQEIRHVAFSMPNDDTLHLPEGLEKLGVQAGVVVAKQQHDLVLLLAADGVVQDDLTFAGLADTHELVTECNDGAFQAIVSKHACTSANDTVAPRAAWNLGDSRFELVDRPNACTCWWFDQP